MKLKGPEHYYISKEDAINLNEELPIEAKYSFNILKKNHGYLGKMSEFIQYLTEIFGIKEFELFDSYTWNNAEFLSYLLDRQIDYKNGKVLDMSQLHKDILVAYDFTRKEKRMFIEEEIEKRLWGLFIYLDNPGKENYKIFN
jgi:hypothetical protein